MYECVVWVARSLYVVLGPWDKVNLGDKSPTVFLVLIYKFVLIKSREKRHLPLFSCKTDTRTGQWDRQRDRQRYRLTDRQWNRGTDLKTAD